MNILDCFSNFYYHRFDIRFSSTQDVAMNCWIGAVFRNGFLKVASEVYDDDNVSLYTHIETLPLSSNHPYYVQFNGGFPKGFYFNCSEFSSFTKGFVLKQQHTYTIQLYLMGSFSKHWRLMLKALELFFMQGIGYPRNPLRILVILEIHYVYWI